MNGYRRRQAIETRLAESGDVAVVDLARELRVSEMTVRRDLEALEGAGVLIRVHGGAVSRAGRSYEPPRVERATRAPAAKEAIGRAAATLVGEGDSAIIDVGTTTLELARALRGKHGLTVVTPSLPVAYELGDEPGIRVLVTGGTLRAGELSLVGPGAEDAFRELNCDVVFLGVAGVAVAEGLTEYSLDDTRVKRAAIRSARRVVALVDATKLGRVALANVCPLTGVDMLVTDAPATHPVVSAMVEAGVELLEAEVAA